MTDFASLVPALAEAAGMPIRPEHLAGVAVNLERLLAQARRVTEVELPTDMEPAAIFRP